MTPRIWVISNRYSLSFNLQIQRHGHLRSPWGKSGTGGYFYHSFIEDDEEFDVIYLCRQRWHPMSSSYDLSHTELSLCRRGKGGVKLTKVVVEEFQKNYLPLLTTIYFTLRIVVFFFFIYFRFDNHEGI